MSDNNFDANKQNSSKANNPSFLVTGATGNIGFELIKILSKENVHIRAAVHSISRSDKILSLGIKDIVEIDFDKVSEISDSIFKDIDKMFLLTPNFETNGLSKLLENAKKAGLKHIVNLSSDSAGIESSSISAKGIEIFKEKEKIIKESGIPCTILRPTAFMQNFLNISFTIKTQKRFYLPWGNGKVSSVDTRDIAAIAAKILASDIEDYKNKIYSITGPEALSCYDIARIFSEVLKVDVEYVNVSDEEAFNEMKRMGMSDILIEYILELSKMIKQEFASYISSSVEEITGKKPISFRQFVEDYKDEFKSNMTF
jgi:uncharacterized protein YbjT (DUF2867 family)